MLRYPLPLLGICAWSGTGKTTLLTSLLPILRERGLRVAVVKHAHHDFDIDRPGKDSYQIREAGAEQILVASRKRMAYIRELPGKRDEPDLAECLPMIDQTSLDLVLVEGFKHEKIAKIELHRSELNKPLMFPDDPHVIAVATDKPLQRKAGQPVNLDLNDPVAIAQFVIEFCHSQQQAGQPCQKV